VALEEFSNILDELRALGSTPVTGALDHVEMSVGQRGDERLDSVRILLAAAKDEDRHVDRLERLVVDLQPRVTPPLRGESLRVLTRVHLPHHFALLALRIILVTPSVLGGTKPPYVCVTMMT
jgi:hypothetical protein